MDAFKKEAIIGDMMDAAHAPRGLLKVKYGPKLLTPGDEMTPESVKDHPMIMYDAEPGAMYSLVMNDLDAPSRANRENAEVVHWFVANIPGNELIKGTLMAEYIGALPPHGTGKHRYVFVLFKHHKKIEYEFPKITLKDTGSRIKKSLKAMIHKYNLGPPEAANFFVSEHDPYVTMKRKEMGLP